jgi:hypothetical protein
LAHVSRRDSQLTPYIPVLHSEKLKVSTSNIWHTRHWMFCV